MRLPGWKKLKKALANFSADQSGMVLVYVTMALPVLIGFSLLAVYVGRLSTLQSTLQHGADALALAAERPLERILGLNLDANSRRNQLHGSMVRHSGTGSSCSRVLLLRSSSSRQYSASSVCETRWA